MATTTKNYGLKKPAQNDYYNIEYHNDNMDIIDTELKRIEDEIDNIDVTGIQITVDQTQAPASPGNGTLAQLFSWLANRIKAITGKSNWWDVPAKTLEDLDTHKVNKSGDTMTGPLIANVHTGTNASRIYKNLVSYLQVPGGGGQVTGTIKIKLPKSWSSTKIRITVKGYDFSSNGGWELILGGYNYAATSSWMQCTAELRGKAPFNQVRFGHDGSYCCILLGSTSTVWLEPFIIVEEMIAGFSNVDSWEKGWEISIITDETGISNIVTPALRKVWDSENDGAGSNMDADTVDGKHASDFQVSATSRVSGIVTYTDSIAGGSTLTKTIALGGSYKQGRVIFSNKLIVEVTTDSSKSFMLGSTRYYIDSSKYYHLPEFYTRQQLGSITKVNDWSDTARGFGAFAVGVTPENTRYVQVQECYINGTNLTIIFSNSSSSAVSMNLPIYWEVW